MKSQPFFPEYLKGKDIWLLWKLEENAKGKATKIPYNALTGGRGSAADPSTWCSFKEASEKYKAGSYSGLGIGISEADGLVFIDIDHCVDAEHRINEQASEILKPFLGRTYCEISQSGTGIHIVALGSIPGSFKNTKRGVEIYNKDRYMCITGNSILRRILIANSLGKSTGR